LLPTTPSATVQPFTRIVAARRKWGPPSVELRLESVSSILRTRHAMSTKHGVTHIWHGRTTGSRLVFAGLLDRTRQRTGTTWRPARESFASPAWATVSTCTRRIQPARPMRSSSVRIPAASRRSSRSRLGARAWRKTGASWTWVVEPAARDVAIRTGKSRLSVSGVHSCDHGKRALPCTRRELPSTE
jgi:hypothetical protein